MATGEMPGELLPPYLLSSDIQGCGQNSGVICNHGNLSDRLLSSAVQIPPVNCKMGVPLSTSAEQDQTKPHTYHVYCRQGPRLRCSW